MKVLDNIMAIVLLVCSGWTLALGAMYATETLPTTQTSLVISTFTAAGLFLWVGLKELS